MTALLIFVHIVICIILILAVLLQSGKAADLAGAFGGVGSQTAFGPRGTATLLSKITTICAVLFMFTSMGLWILSAKGDRSVVRSEEKGTPAAVETKKEGQVPDAQKQAATPAAKTQEPEKKEPAPEKAEPEKKESPPQKKD
ncbi:MAG: preprotein translocase subunit SecG [Acidobacteriota bacterium]